MSSHDENVKFYQSASDVPVTLTPKLERCLHDAHFRWASILSSFRLNRARNCRQGCLRAEIKRFREHLPTNPLIHELRRGNFAFNFSDSDFVLIKVSAETNFFDRFWFTLAPSGFVGVPNPLCPLSRAKKASCWWQFPSLARIKFLMKQN